MKMLRLGLAVSLLAAASATTIASTATAPELQILSMVNQARAEQGLVPLRSDPRLWALADERAAVMASAEELSHSAAGSIADGLSRQGVQWYLHGEVIAYTSGSPAESLFRLWASSPPHWALLTHRSFNYLGIGLAYSSSGLAYGSIILTESKDRTGPRARMVKATISGDDVRWIWSGSDTALQTHTAGVRNFCVQQRTDGGSWVTVSNGTTSTAHAASNRARGHWYGLRVRARDRAGNVGPWSPELRVRVP